MTFVDAFIYTSAHVLGFGIRLYPHTHHAGNIHAQTKILECEVGEGFACVSHVLLTEKKERY